MSGSKRWRAVALTRWLLIGVLVASGCAHDDTATVLPRGTVTAVIDGEQFAATSLATATFSGGTLHIVANSTTAQLSMQAFLLNNSGDSAAIAPIGGSAWASLTIGGQQWSTGFGGSGVVTYGGGSAGHAIGTFEFVAGAVPSSGATGNRSVVNGAFDITY